MGLESMKKIIFLLLFTSDLFAQPSAGSKLVSASDSSWVEYLVPDFMQNVTPEGNGSPHFGEYLYRSNDNKVDLQILLNISYRIIFEIKRTYQGRLEEKDVKITYKSLKEDRYYLSGKMADGRILYEFCREKDGYGYTYSLRYDTAYSSYFNQQLPTIIKGFRILRD
jgi:hypothetical protein